MATVSRLTDYQARRRIFFSRTELDILLQLYSRQVMRGAWRDYAIDQREGRAVFSIFRHSLESPLYTIVKTAPGIGRHGDFVLMRRCMRLATGGALAEVLAPLKRELRRTMPRGTALFPYAPA
jgi:Protein of unknown function (DUF2794)